MTPEYALYFHIPFCTHRCAYCDFNTYAGHESLIPAYVEALIREVEFVARAAPQRLPVHTIFFGGGTPSLLTPHQFERILQTVRSNFTLVPTPSSNPSTLYAPSIPPGSSGSSALSGSSDTSGSSETSLEANPGTVTLASLKGLRQAGFNRISYGVQSFHPDELRMLERIHNPFDVLDAVRWARQAGFGNLNLDLIYGLPEQTLARWQASLRHAVELAPEHLSLYALTIENGTPFGRWAAQGLLPLPDPDLAADMYEAASDFLAEQGYQQYEISNWTQPGFQCRHNLQYWRNLPYLGFGAGAHGCANGLRVSNVLRIKTYIEHFISLRSSPTSLFPPFPISPATVTRSALTRHTEMQETLMLGLRLTQEGVSAQSFWERFGQELMDVFGNEINELVDLGLLEFSRQNHPLPPDQGAPAVRTPPSPLGEGADAQQPHPSSEREGAGVRIRLTPRGRLLGNQVFLRFVD
jgi:oxygen-independent coproporphyrinogen-3 oxidase